jgi:hypothetical protein
MAVMGLNKTVANFKIALCNLMLQLVLEQAYSDQHQYLLRVRKPNEMNVNTFIARICQIQELTEQLPKQDNEPAMTNHNYKYIVYNALPRSFQNQYALKYNDSMHSISLQKLGKRMSRIQRVFDLKAA